MAYLMRFCCISRFFNRIFNVLTRIEDYFCELRGVPLTEWFLFSLAGAWTFAFTCFEVKGASPVFDYIWSENSWNVIFVILTITHIIGFYRHSVRLRFLAVSGYAFSSTIWIFITFAARPQSPIWESMIAFTVFAVIAAVRVGAEERPVKRARVSK